MTKAKDMFNTLFQIEELTKDEFLSIIWSNPVEDDFISAMCALMDFFPYDENLTKHNNDFKTKLEMIYIACNDERVFEIQNRIGDLLKKISIIKS